MRGLALKTTFSGTDLLVSVKNRVPIPAIPAEVDDVDAGRMVISGSVGLRLLLETSVATGRLSRPGGFMGGSLSEMP